MSVLLCYFDIADNAKLTPKEMIDPCMADIRYWKLFHTHYETDTEIGRLLKRAQAEAFVNERKGIPVPAVVMDKLSSDSSPIVGYPQLGPNTNEKDFEELCLCVADRQPRSATFINFGTLT